MPEQDKDFTVCLMRRLRHNPQKSELIALFPFIKETGEGNCLSYMHVGQHGAANYRGMMRNTTPALPCEYQDLRVELETIGYRLKIRSRRNGRKEGTR